MKKHDFGEIAQGFIKPAEKPQEKAAATAAQEQTQPAPEALKTRPHTKRGLGRPPKHENLSKSILLRMRPSLYERVYRYTQEQETSVNAFINWLVNEYLTREGE